MTTGATAAVWPIVLVVDDEMRNRVLVRAYLSDTYHVLEAEGAARAFAILKEEPVDLVLLDVMMPEMDGLEACRVMKQRTSDPYLPVLLLTALGDQQERNAGLEAGADDFLTKPVDRQELLLRVNAFIRIKRQDDRIHRQLRKVTERDRLIQRQLEELERMAVARRQWAAELERANRELEAFSYAVSHDLRAPLRAIDGFSEALLTDQADRLDDQGRSDLARIRKATAHMSSLIDGLLDLSRVTGGQLDRESVNLSQIAEAVLEELGRRDPTRRVTSDLEAGLVASGDRRLVTVALENLLGNAWKFSARRAEAHIELGRVVLDGEVTFFVRDDGAGFDPTYGGKLFKAFQRLHSRAEFDGTGIGLATVGRIVARHGGRIWAESSVDKGATFFFTLCDRDG
ncbi:MAG TPA: response regulator [Kofleriaceae bacterium]|nr:response regulator [Kofleriaceae bacterium]